MVSLVLVHNNDIIQLKINIKNLQSRLPRPVGISGN